MADATAAASTAPAHAAPRGRVAAFNAYSVWAMYRFQMVRFFRTLGESLATPVITTALYFVVFGSAIGNRMQPVVEGLEFGSFIVPGLIMLSIFTNSIFNASFGIYFPKFTGTIYELLSAPISYLEIVIAFVGAAATKSVILGLVILATAYFFVPVKILHPVEMVAILILVSFAFSLFGFIIGIWAQSFEQLNFIPMLIVTPLTFLGGAFYTLEMLPEAWRGVAALNPVVYLISGFRWAFFGLGSDNVVVSLTATLIFVAILLAVVGWIFRTGYRLKN
ncbi:MAG TPA: ABC transporter permease [Hyphomonadaceae bacterium]|nr:ABC transporter permease [Hyphomonadaceae bacterium]